MSCGCENRKMAMELDRTRRLAKALAKMEGQTVGIYAKTDGTWCFDVIRKLNEPERNKVKEYITPY